MSAPSYAAVASHNAPPPSKQPHADPGLLTTPSQTLDAHTPDVAGPKINVVSHDFKDHPKTIVVEHTDSEGSSDEGNVPGSRKRKARKDKKKNAERRAKANVNAWWAWAENAVMQPAVAGGVFSVVNIGILSTLGYQVYKNPSHITSPDTRTLAITGAGLASLFAAETVIANAYLNTDRGQEEKRRAEEEGALIWAKTKQVVLRPGVFGGIVGFVNVAVLGGLGYTAYTHWEYDPFWSRKNISIATVGLITWFSGQGFIIEKYHQEGYPKKTY